MTKRAPAIRFLTVDLQKIRTAEWPADQSGKPPLLFFNGIGGNLEMAQPLADLLAGDRPLIALDVPGTGKSPDPVLPYRPWWMARAAKKILEKLGYDGPVDVFGVSWGGGMAQQFAIQYRSTVNKLILAATSAGAIMVPGDFGAISKMTGNKRYTDPDYLMKNYEALYGETDPEAMKGHTLRIIPPTQKGYMFQLLAMLGWTSVPFLPFLKAPTLVMGGDQDRLVPLINSKFLATLIPDSRLEVIEGGGHLFMLSQAPYIISLIQDFLDGDAEVLAA